MRTTITLSALSQVRRPFYPFTLMSTRLLIIACIFCAFSFSTAYAATYYLDAVNGNDDNPGTSQEPWKTISKAESTVAKGDTVLLKDGNYGDVYINSKNLDRSSWSDGVIYKADSNATPIFTYLSISEPEDRYLEFNKITINAGPGKGCVQIKDSRHIKLLNMNLKGYWSPHNDAGLSVCGVLTKTTGATVVEDITIQDCTIHDVLNGVSIGYNIGSGIVVRNNTIYHFGSTGISLSPSNTDSSGTIVIDKNSIFNKESIVEELIITGAFNGTFAIDETVNQTNTDGTATGKLTRVDSNTISVRPTSTVIFNFNTKAAGITGQTSGAALSNPSLSDYVTVHGSGISIRCNRVTISRNIIRDCGTTRGIRTYPGVFPTTGYQDITIENNLIYDIANASTIELVDIGDNFIFNNNTVVGYHTHSDVMARKYTSALNLSPASTKNGSGFSMYNNVLVGELDINPGFTNYNENNNIIWSVYDGSRGASPVYLTSLKGEHTKIIAFDNKALSPNYFEANGNFFAGGTNFDLYHANRQTKVINPYSGEVADMPHQKDLSICYMLRTGSDGIDWGNTNHAPLSDILGHSRDSSPDAGCYEYTGPTSNKPPNADAGSDQTLTDSDQNGSEQVTLDGSGSTDPDGSIEKYEWFENLNEPNIATGVKPTVSLPVGRHTITLQVTDNKGDTAKDTVVITVELEEGLVGYWKFNEGAGSYANDSSGIGTSGRLINGPAWTNQGEIRLDGNNDAIEIGTQDMNANAGSIALWAYPEAFSKKKHFLFGHVLSSGNRIQVFCDVNGTLGVGLGNNASLKTDIQTLNTQEWYHIALTWNGTAYAVYVDGAQKASGAFSGINGRQTYADIGNNGIKSQLSEAFDGLIDEFRLYNKPLDANEISNLALVFLPIDDKTTDEGVELSFPIRTKSGVIMELSDLNLPSTPSFTSNIFTWTPNYGDAGTYDIEFTAPHGDKEDFEKVTVCVMDTQQEEPIGYWKFDETSGEIAYDSSTSGNNGCLRNGLVWLNGAVEFSIPNDAVEIQTANLNPKTGTIAMWVYVERQTLSTHYLFGYSNSNFTNRIQLYLKYGDLCLGLGNSHETVKNVQQLQNSQWYHIALTWSGTNYKMFVDGQLKALGTFSGLTEFTGHADIGNNGINRDKALDGRIDDVLIYNRALTNDEITQLATGH